MATQPETPGVGSGSGTTLTSSAIADQRIDLGAEGSIAGRVQCGSDIVGVSYAINATTWGSAVVHFQFSFDDQTWYDGKQNLQSTNPYRQNIDCKGIMFTRLEVTTADITADENASVDIVIIRDSNYFTEFGV